MNLNNLENLKEEMKTLGFKDKLIVQMEAYMKKDVRDFKLHDTVPATRGQVDLTLHFKQSMQSDHYYFNKYEAVLNQSKPLEEGQKYMVISPSEVEGKNMTKKLDTLAEAIIFFQEQKGNSELAVGKDEAHRTKLAGTENGKVNYVAKDFQRSFYAQPIPQTFWIDQGNGFNALQAANLVQSRYVYRDDLISTKGVPYMAWKQLDKDKARDRHGNLEFKTFNDPAFGFNLQRELDKFIIKELNDPAKKELLEASLKNGNREQITTMMDGKEVKKMIEPAVRYGKINFFDPNGKPEKREQFLKEPALDKTVSQNKGKSEELAESQGLKR